MRIILRVMSKLLEHKNDMRHNKALPSGSCIHRSHRHCIYLKSPRSLLRLYAILTILMLCIASQTALAYRLDKTLFLSYVEHRMQQTRTQGLSGAYFSIADIPRFIRTVDEYIHGVYIDPAYLSDLASTDTISYLKSYVVNLQPDQGYTQGKGGDANKHPSEKDAFDGSIILVNTDTLDKPTAMHEAIHAFAFARHLGELERDDYNGPEFISGQLVGLMIRLHYLDQDVEKLTTQARAGSDITAGRSKLFRSLDVVERLYSSESPQMQQLLYEMGGKADFDGYHRAIEQSLDAAAAASRGVSPRSGMKIRDYCPSAPKRFSGEKAFSDEKCPSGIRRYRLVPRN